MFSGKRSREAKAAKQSMQNGFKTVAFNEENTIETKSFEGVGEVSIGTMISDAQGQDAANKNGFELKSSNENKLFSLRAVPLNHQFDDSKETTYRLWLVSTDKQAAPSAEHAVLLASERESLTESTVQKMFAAWEKLANENGWKAYETAAKEQSATPAPQ